MKKTRMVLMVMMFLFSVVLIGCAAKENVGEKDKGKGTDEPASNNNEGNEEEPEQVTITIASWEDEEIRNATITAFEEAFPHIKVEQDESITWPWNEALAASAAAGTLPDVMWLFMAPPAYQHEWAADLTPFLEADPDFNKEDIFGTIVDDTNYNGKQVALPRSLGVHGVYVNLDLFEKENKDVPTADWTMEEARELARDMTKANDGQFGFQATLGVRDALFGQFDPKQGWATFDGEQFNFDSQGFIDTINTVTDIVNKDKADVESLSEEERLDMYGEGNDPWSLGKIAMKWDGTWGFAGSHENADFNWDFLPYPKVVEQRSPLVSDYIGISSTSKQKEAAFEFVKFVTYSKDGWLKRIEVENPIGSIPIINDSEVWEAYLASEFVPAGMRDVIPFISNGFVDPLKSSPGYAPGMDASIWFEDNGDKLMRGETRPEDVGPIWQEQADKAAKEATEAVLK